MKLRKGQGGRALRGFMRATGMRRQKELAVALKLSEPTISLILRGHKSFSPKTAMRVSRITGIPLEELFQ